MTTNPWLAAAAVPPISGDASTPTTVGATLRAARHAVVAAQALAARVRDDVAGG